MEFVTNRPTITVAVATCGKPEALARCLGALAVGDLAPDEVIVVDQAPTSAARDCLAQVSPTPARYIEQARLGLSASRNAALTLARTSWLAVTDDDCVPDPGWLAGIATAIGQAPSPTAISGPILANGPKPDGGHAISLRESLDAVDHRGAVVPWTVGSGANFAAPTAALRELGGWDERLGTGSPGRAGEDAELLYRVLESGGLVRYSPQAVIRHDWQTWQRRLSTRWSYGFGIGAFLGIRARHRDRAVPRLLASYYRLQIGLVGSALRGRHPSRLHEGLRAAAGPIPGFFYGLRVADRSSRSDT